MKSYKIFGTFVFGFGLSIIFLYLFSNVSFDYKLTEPVNFEPSIASTNEEIDLYYYTKMCICRVESKYSVGTGFVFHEDDQYYYVMTAAHVLFKNNIFEVNQVIHLSFFSINYAKQQNIRVGARIVWIKYNNNTIVDDIAILRFRKGSIPYKFIVAQFDTTMPSESDNYITSGCEDGLYPTTLIGFIQNINNELLLMIPKFAAGRSGSPIFNVENRKVVGLILRSGRAVNSSTIYDILGWKKNE